MGKILVEWERTKANDRPEFLGAGTRKVQRPDEVGACGGGLSFAARRGGAVSVHFLAGGRLRRGGGDDLPFLPPAGL